MTSGPSNPPQEPLRGRVWRFAECEFDELRYELRVGGVVVEIERKPLEVLLQLLLRAGEVVRKEDLLELVWPGVMVVDASLATAVSKLRKVLSDDAIIKTVAKVGYRLSVPVQSDRPAEAESVAIASATVQPATSPGRRWNAMFAWGLVAIVVASLATGGFAYLKKSRSNAMSGPIAILPFQNVGSNQELDYLRLALADEAANSLGAARSANIRPLAMTSRYAAGPVDLQRAARELNVKRIVTGDFALAGDQLQITMEAVDTDEDRVLWHETVNVPANNLLAMQAQVAAMSRSKLAAALGIHDFAAAVAPSQNEAAYELYLRATALDWDPAPNKEGLDLLRRSVLLDPSYAPAWGLLSLRYYRDSRFGDGGVGALQLSDAAAEKELALDPDSPQPVAELTVHRTERGDLVKAHEIALELVRRRPDRAETHHVLSYVLQYGGSLEDAKTECNTVVMLDSQIVWGSCSSVLMELGDYPRALTFVRKDLSSEWSKAHAIEIRMRQGNVAEALRIGTPQIAHWGSYKMLLACAAGAPPETINALAKGVEVNDDPEVTYFFAAHLAYCGQTDAALRMLKTAIAGNYCSYPAMDHDPFFDKIRKDPRFVKVRQTGIACHDDFVANRLPTPTPTNELAQQ